jgi:phenylpropionate dioxygenase-like ring-hydroxylating dioxygenase large terminal subunit
MFIRNQWYVAAWDGEVGRKPLARTLLGEPIVLYRRIDGGVAAMADACPHRLAPLSIGMVEGDNIRCKYHGVMFDGEGGCVEMPGQGQRLDYLKVRTYPVVERYRFVWVWIGEADKADPALLPDLWPCEAEGWAFDGGAYFIKANYKLMIDNLMDLTHETHVHPGSIGQAELMSAPIQVKAEGEQVFVSRWMPGVDNPPFWQMNSGLAGPVDRWQICRFIAPSAVIIDVGVAPVGVVGGIDGERTKGANGFVVDLMTPSSENTCWYFWGLARNFHVSDPGFGQRARTAQGKVFMEDVEVLEAQQATMDALPDQKIRAFDIDGGAVRARAVLDRMERAQAQQAATQSAA